jgi:hypothetical protein
MAGKDDINEAVVGLMNLLNAVGTVATDLTTVAAQIQTKLAVVASAGVDTSDLMDLVAKILTGEG